MTEGGNGKLLTARGGALRGQLAVPVATACGACAPGQLRDIPKALMTTTPRASQLSVLVPRG